MTKEIKSPYGDMHLSDDQKEMLKKEQHYQNASSEEKAAMEEKLYAKDGLVGESAALFFDEDTDKYLSRPNQNHRIKVYGLDKNNIERAMLFGDFPESSMIFDGHYLPKELPIWSGKQPDGFGGVKYFDHGFCTRTIMSYPNFSPALIKIGTENSINRSIKDIEKFFDNPDTYKNLKILRNTIEGAEKHIGSYEFPGWFKNQGTTKYFCELPRDTEKNRAEELKALSGLYDSFINKTSAIHASPLIRLLTPSMAFSDKSAFEKRSWFTDSMLADYTFAKYNERVKKEGYPKNDGKQFYLEPHPPEESYSGSDFHNIMAHMFVRMAERFGMFDAETQEDRNAIKEKVIRWEKYIFAGRAYEMLSNPNHKKYLFTVNDIMPYFELSPEDKETLETYCKEHMDSGFTAEKELARKLLDKLIDPNIPMFLKDSRHPNLKFDPADSSNSVMGLGYELRDDQDRPIEIQYAEKFHEAMIKEGDSKDKEWAERIDLKDDFDAILYGRYM